MILFVQIFINEEEHKHYKYGSLFSSKWHPKWPHSSCYKTPPLFQGAFMDPFNPLIIFFNHSKRPQNDTTKVQFCIPILHSEFININYKVLRSCMQPCTSSCCCMPLQTLVRLFSQNTLFFSSNPRLSSCKHIREELSEFL